MKRIALLALFLLSSCAPSEQAIQTAIAETQNAKPFPTFGFQPTMPPATPTAMSPTPAPSLTSVPTSTTATCTNRSSYGILDEQEKQVCMQSTYYPCMRWDQVTSDMKGATICVRGTIRKLEEKVEKKKWISRWDFSENGTGFFATSYYMGWHPTTGKDIAVGDCIAMTGKVQIISNGRPYIFWGENSIYRGTVPNVATYWEHPDLFVIEGNPSFCE